MSSGISAAFVLGAGMGNRLRPLTDSRPKPLIPIFNKPLVTFALDHLRSAGVRKFVINTHHLADQFARFFPDGEYCGCPVRLEFEPVRLETGGGIANAAPWLGHGDFLVYSGDILTDIDLDPLIEAHYRDGNDVTLALRVTGLASDVACVNGRVVDVRGRYGHQGEHDFANVAVWSPRAVEWIPKGVKIPSIPVLVERIAQGARIGGVVLADGEWFNVGSRDEYLKVHTWIAGSGWKPGFVTDPAWPLRIHPDARVEPGATVSGGSAIGAGSEVAAGAVVEDSVVWDDAKIASGARLRDCIVRDFQLTGGVLCHQDV